MSGKPKNIFDRFCMELCSLVLPGRSPLAPGTAGSLAAAVLAPWLFLPLPLMWRGVVLAGIFVVGGIAATRVEKVLRKKDPGLVIIDEVLGQWITYLPFGVAGGLPMIDWWGLGLGFVLFRIFDILKPVPVRQSEDWLPSGFGVMIDDTLAGGYALLGMWGLLAIGIL